MARAGGKMKSVKLSSLKKQKGKRWKRGQSCVTNPETNKHRSAAKKRFFSVNTGPSELTIDAISKHNAVEAGRDEEEMLSDTGSEVHSAGGKTFSTWASNWTECTNATFGRVHRYCSSSSAMHKEILAVLAAVTEVIKERGGQETETEYFAALMVTMETVDNETSLAAVSYLLNLAMKRVPTAVLQKKFPEVSKFLLDVLAKHLSTDAPSLLRSVVKCLAHLLRVQDQSAWANSSTLQVYSGLLSFISHPKPKVRKAAQDAVRAVLKGSVFMTQDRAPAHHPAASATAKFCVKQMDDCGGMGESTTALHVLGLLTEVMAVFPGQSLKPVCETILRLLTLSNVLVTSVAMKALYGLFAVQPKETCLSSALNAQLITALYDYQPGENDVQPMTAWLAVMEKALVNLYRLKASLCLGHLPRLISACMTCLQSGKAEISRAAAKTIQTLLKECVAPSADQLGVSLEAAPSSGGTLAHKMFQPVEKGLSYQYHGSWGLVLQILAKFFEVLGKQCHSIMKKCLVSLADLRDSHNFSHKVDLDRAVGVAVHTMGPRIVLDAAPLQITGQDDDFDFPRSWLLPILRDNVKDTELIFFTSYFLPLAARLRAKSIEYAKESAMVQAKTYDALQLQIWSMLPGFCTRPTDIKQSFKGIAKILGSALTDRRDIRVHVLTSLRRLILQNLNNDENREELAKFAKNFLPLLFNLFTEEPENQRDQTRLAVLETIKVYLQICDMELTCSFFDKCQLRLSASDTPAFTQHALMDLAIAMVPLVNEQRLSVMYPAIIEQLTSSDHTIQKKSYRVLEEMCIGKSDACKSFVTSTLGELQQQLLQSLSGSSPSSKSPRLKCLLHIFKKLEDPHLDFLRAVVPEAILCTKGTAERARAAAFGLLVEMGRTLARWQSELAPQESLTQYMEIVMAGLAGSPHLVACTVLALTRILHENRGIVGGDLLETLVQSVCLLLASKAREVVESAFGLLKVILSTFKDTQLAPFLQEVVSSLVKMKEENKHHFRFKAKEIFTRLVRKFGYPVIQGMVPASHQKVLTNIRKVQERAKRQGSGKENPDEEEDEDEEEEWQQRREGSGTKAAPESISELLRDTDSEVEDDEEEVDKGAAKKGGSQQRKKKTDKSQAAWLKEKSDEIVDFLDPSVSKQVLATKPECESGSGRSSKVKHDFKMASDGRLIITEGADEEEEPKKGKKMAVVDDLDELIDAMEGPSKRAKKRKLPMVAGEEETEQEPAMKYKAGGRGIHRLVGQKKQKMEKKNPGAEYKSKKAGGDLKRKGRPDPFAYMPLEFKNLNKRKKAKAAGQFRNLVRGAKKGASKGHKQRSKPKK